VSCLGGGCVQGVYVADSADFVECLDWGWMDLVGTHPPNNKGTNSSHQLLTHPRLDETQPRLVQQQRRWGPA